MNAITVQVAGTRSDPPAGTIASKWDTRIARMLIVAVTIATLWPVCTCDFTSWDDPKTIARNPTLNPPTIRSIRVWWSQPHVDLYIPVTYMAWGAIASMAHVAPEPGTGIELNPYVFHTCNLLIHVTTALVVFQVLLLVCVRRATFSIGGLEKEEADRLKPGLRTWAAGAGAVLFAIHPVQVEPVAWISGMKDLLCGLFAMLALWGYLISLPSGSPSGAAVASVRFPRLAPYLAASACLILAMLSKPTAMVIPLIAATLDLLIVRRPIRRVAASIAPWLLLAIPCALCAKWAQPALSAHNTVRLWVRPLVAADAMGFYVYKLIWPARLAIDYGRTPAWVIEHGAVWWTWVVPAFIATMLYIFRRRSHPAATGALIFIFGLLPVLGLIPFDFQLYSTVADHYLYIPMFGVALIFAWGVQRLEARIAIFAAAAILGTLATRAWFQSWNWRSSETLYQHTMSVNPESYAASGNLADLYIGDHRLDLAEHYARETIRINPHYMSGYTMLGIVLVQEKRMNEATQVYFRAFAANPNDASAASGVGYILSVQGRWREALDYLRRATGLDPGSAQDHRNFAMALAMNHQIGAALVEFGKALQRAPDDAEIHARFAEVLSDAGEREEARREYEIATRLDPNLMPAPPGATHPPADRSPPPK